jgi:hypothetical protein
MIDFSKYNFSKFYDLVVGKNKAKRAEKKKKFIETYGSNEQVIRTLIEKVGIYEVYKYIAANNPIFKDYELVKKCLKKEVCFFKRIPVKYRTEELVLIFMKYEMKYDMNYKDIEKTINSKFQYLLESKWWKKYVEENIKLQQKEKDMKVWWKENSKKYANEDSALTALERKFGKLKDYFEI